VTEAAKAMEQTEAASSPSEPSDREREAV
jgi:hypothetical protein